MPLVAVCAADLGHYSVGNVATCVTGSITITTTGQSIVTCLNNALSGTCITGLPSACSSLGTEMGLGLITDVPLCATALGPFVGGAVAVCLTTNDVTSTTTGSGFVTCIENALGLTATTTTATATSAVACAATSSPTSTGCAVSLPRNCTQLAGESVAALLIDGPTCLTSLGVYGAGNAAACLATNIITTGASGSSIITCLTTALEASCPAILPTACGNISSATSQATILLNIPLCVAALGPYAAGNAATCLATDTVSSTTLGSSIVDCLNTALSIS